MKTKETKGEAVKAKESGKTAAVAAKPEAVRGDAESVMPSDFAARLREETPIIEMCVADVGSQVGQVYNLVCDMRYASEVSRNVLLGKLADVSSSLLAAYRSLRSSLETVCRAGAPCKAGGR